MKLFLFGIVIFANLYISMSCSKSSAPYIPVVPPPVDTTKQNDVTSDVYIAGFQNNHAGYWKNSQFISLGNSNPKSYAQDMAFEGNDIYVLGQSGDSLGYWKNGQFNLVSTNDSLLPNAIAINGIDVYSYYQNIFAGLWPGTVFKNDEYNATILTETEPGAANMVIDGGDVYIPGSTETISNHPAYWKNGVRTLLDSSRTDAVAYGIAVASSTVYAVGHALDRTGSYWIASIWKQGIETFLSDSSSCVTARFIQVSGNDVYVVGAVLPGTIYTSGTTISTILWKNGIATVLTKAGDQDTPEGLAVDGSDVYVSVNSLLASGEHVLRYYKNGTSVIVTPQTNAGGQRIFVRHR